MEFAAFLEFAQLEIGSIEIGFILSSMPRRAQSLTAAQVIGSGLLGTCRVSLRDFQHFVGFYKRGRFGRSVWSWYERGGLYPLPLITTKKRGNAGTWLRTPEKGTTTDGPGYVKPQAGWRYLQSALILHSRRKCCRIGCHFWECLACHSHGSTWRTAVDSLRLISRNQVSRFLLSIAVTGRAVESITMLALQGYGWIVADG